jgi:hypothetical protein
MTVWIMVQAKDLASPTVCTSCPHREVSITMVNRLLTDSPSLMISDKVAEIHRVVTEWITCGSLLHQKEFAQEAI